MSDEAPELSDLEIELLHRLAGTSTFTDALRHPKPLAGMSTKALAKPTVNKAVRQLSQLTGDTVQLLKPAGRRGTFATPACHALAPALAAIARDREAARAAALRKRQLEWLQLASCLDKEPLRIGAYQAHAERFLATAGQLMVHYFPWIDSEIFIEENRERSDNSRGIVRDRFDSGHYDVMLVPRDSEKIHLEFVYAYSFRVIGTPEKLFELRDKHGIIDRRKLRGEKLIVSPAGSSSRQRLRELMLDAGIDIEANADELIVERNPNTMRTRALTGQGLAIMSDEYMAIGASTTEFPYLGLGPGDEDHQEVHRVEMGLLRQPWADKPRHQAFYFVIQELVALEKVRARDAAQD
jgi:hypothetical protein